MTDRIPREIKGRIRSWVAAELVARVAEAPPDDESVEVQNAWREYVCEIARQIKPS